MVTTIPALQLSRDEIADLVEREAQRRRGLSARQLLGAYRQGRLESPGDVADLLVLADLLPQDDPLFAAA